MKSRMRFLVLLMVVAPALLQAQNHPTFENVTLVQRDGWTYRHVSVRLTDDGQDLAIRRQDGAGLELPVGEVALIRDADGVDITRQVIPDAPVERSRSFDEFGTGGGTADRISGTDPSRSRLRRVPRLFSVMPSIGLGFGSGEGDFYNGLDSGLLYYADVRIATTESRYVKIAYRSVNLFQEDVPVTDYDGNYVGDVEVRVDVRQYLFSVGFLSPPNGRNIVRVYGEFGAGWGDHVIKASVGSESESDGEGRVMILGQAGLLFPFGKNSAGLDLGVSALFKLFGEYDNEGGGFILHGHLGVMVPFGGDR